MHPFTFYNKYRSFSLNLIINVLLVTGFYFYLCYAKSQFINKVSYILWDNFDFNARTFFALNFVFILMIMVTVFSRLRLKKDSIENVIYTVERQLSYLMLLNCIVMFFSLKSIDCMNYEIYKEHLHNLYYDLYYYINPQNVTYPDKERLIINNVSVVLNGKH